MVRMVLTRLKRPTLTLSLSANLVIIIYTSRRLSLAPAGDRDNMMPNKNLSAIQDIANVEYEFVYQICIPHYLQQV